MAASSVTPPVAVVCIGMAGSGKTTFMQRINAHLHQTDPVAPYLLNLDPAVRSVPFDSNIDIRDSVNYKEVMKQYNLGPNGAILTSLNLFATKIDQVMGILEKRCVPSSEKNPADPSQSKSPKSPPPSHILIDTPGQIEVFVWSASGSILLSSLASTFPTVLAYVVDTPRTTANTSTFMSNMLYAISILYKTRLPMILVFNKTDVTSADEAVEWMRDFESFQTALRAEEAAQEQAGGGYMGSLLNSMSLVLEEFYNQLSVVAVSAMTGDGVVDFFNAVRDKRAEFERDYRPELERRRKEGGEMQAQVREAEVARMVKDMRLSSPATRAGERTAAAEPETVSDMEDMDDEDEDLAGEGGRDGEDKGDEDDFDEDALFEQSFQARYEAARQHEGVDAAAAGASADYIRRTQR